MKLLVLMVSLLTTTAAIAGCPAIRVFAHSTIKKCEYKKDPSGALLEIESSRAEVKKTKIFFSHKDASVCNNFKVNGDYCLELNQWCIMSGNPPHGVRYILGQFTNGKCTSAQQDIPHIGSPPTRAP